MATRKTPEPIKEFRFPNSTPVLADAYFPSHELRRTLENFTREPPDNVLLHPLDVGITPRKEIRAMLPKHVLHRLGEEERKGKREGKPQQPSVQLPQLSLPDGTTRGLRSWSRRQSNDGRTYCCDDGRGRDDSNDEEN